MYIVHVHVHVAFNVSFLIAYILEWLHLNSVQQYVVEIYG